MKSARDRHVAFKAFLLSFLALMLSLGAPRTGATRFSLDPASPSIDGDITPDDILTPGPRIELHGTALGLLGFFDNLADISFGFDPIQSPLYFSVDRVAVGLPGSAVFMQASPGLASAAGDVYVALPPVGSNVTYIQEQRLGLQPGFFGDDLDALELDSERDPFVYFTIDRLSATNGFGVFDLANDILISDASGSFGVYRPDISIGLVPEDAIDGLVLDVRNETALFSLDPFSPSTFISTGLDYVPCLPGHMSPADVCITHFTGSYTLWAAANDIGLQWYDNVDALDTVPVPEPGTVPLLLGSLMALGVLAVRRARASAGASAATRSP